MTAGRPPPGASARTYAPCRNPAAGAYFARSMTATFWRVSTRATGPSRCDRAARHASTTSVASPGRMTRSEEHTSELQSHSDLVCRLLLEKKKAHRICRDLEC